MAHPLPHPLPHPLRLRQVCLVAPRLEPVVADLQAIFGLAVCHRDPGLIAYGLENALLPVGNDFIEVVAPVQAHTAAGRFLQKSRGHGGYMAIFQAHNPRERQAAAAAMGVRTAHQIDRPDYLNAQLHPRDCRAAFIEFGHSQGGGVGGGVGGGLGGGEPVEPRNATWWPAGPDWPAFVRTDTTQRLVGITLESPDSQALALHWSRILGLPLTAAHGAPCIDVDGSTITTVPGPADALAAVLLAVADVPAALGRAVDCGHWVQGNSFHMAGVHLRLQAA